MAGAHEYRQYGYRGRREAVIPNGVDTTRFEPDEEGRARVRAEWGIAPRRSGSSAWSDESTR